MGPKTKFSDNLHAIKYRQENEPFRDFAIRIADTLTDSESQFHELKEVVGNQMFLHGGRIQSSIGTLLQSTALNCYVSMDISDSMTSIMQAAVESAETMRMGGGIGYDFSSIRPKGDKIKTLNSYASGPVSFMRIYDAVCKTIASAGHRRGAQMGVLRIDHPDILEFIKCKHNNTELTAFNISIGVTDEFIYCLKNRKPFNLVFEGKVYKTIDPGILWEEVMRSTWDWAEPGIIFIDRVNEQNNLRSIESIKTSNPCVVGTTTVLTKDGYIPIKELVDKETTVWNGFEWSEVIPKVTGHDKEIVEIQLSNGRNISCTLNHKFVLKNGETRIEAKDLVIGSELIEFEYPVLEKFYKLNMSIIKSMERMLYVDAEKEEIYFEMTDSYEMLVRTLNYLGCKCTVQFENKLKTKYDDIGRCYVENVGFYKVNISSNDMKKLFNITPTFHTEIDPSIKVISIKKRFDREEKVYCYTEPKRNLACFNGILTGNCGEQMLPPYGACCLGSFNLVKFCRDGEFKLDEMLDLVPLVTRSMDNVLDRTNYPLPKQKQEAIDKRRLGIGITGLANAGSYLGFTYGDDKFVEFEYNILAKLAEHIYSASCDLAQEKGAFPMLEKVGRENYVSTPFVKKLPKYVQEKIIKNGIRNSHLTSIAPTGTISLCADNVSPSIEPPFNLKTERTIQLFEGPEQVKVVDYAYNEWGIKGKTSDEVTVDEHLSVQAVAQIWIDSSVSKTCNVGSKVSYKNFKDIYIKGYDKGLKGLTTFRLNGKRFSIMKSDDSEPGTACTIDPVTGDKSCDT